MTQQYAVNVPYTVAVTTYQAQPRQVTENVTPRSRGERALHGCRDDVPGAAEAGDRERDPAVRGERALHGCRDDVPGAAEAGHREHDPQYAVNVPYTVAVTTYQAQQKQVTENVTPQYAVQVPYTVPVTCYTTQARQVARQVPVTRQVLVPVTVPAAVAPAPAAVGPSTSPQR